MLHNKKPAKYEKYAIIILIIAIIIRFSLIPIYSPSGDACWHFSASKFIGNNVQIPLFDNIGRDEPFWAPPLFHIIAALFSSVFSVFGSGFGLKLISPLFGSMSLIVSYLILKKFLNEKALFYSILFLSFIPIFIDYSILGYVESMLTFFVLLSIYFTLNSQLVLSGIAVGLAILTKYNGIFVIPVILFIVYKNYNRKLFSKNAAIALIIPLIIGLPWFIRNWVLLGNPIYPFLSFIFGGFGQQAFSTIDLTNLFSIKTYIITYLGFFGVPDGNYNSLFFIDLPYLPILLSVFLIATIIFIIPVFFGLRKNKWDIFHILLLSYGILFILYIINVGPFVSRILLPTIISLAFFYGIGMERITSKYKIGALFSILVILISAGFVITEAAKFTIASRSWDVYQEDFNWVKSNTNKEDIFIAGGQCVQYHIDRTSLFPSELKTGRYDYIWVNQNFMLDERSILSKEHLQEIEGKNKELAYENKKTSTKIYKLVQ
jgi:4-amino-4-deoxy-L-arabinose transferase-like glycosyltransferase